MKTDRPRRSALYLPASNPRAIEKARGLPCDVVILDLEDAVVPEQKGVGREAALAAVRGGGFGASELVVRTNAFDTPWGGDDLAAFAEVGADALLIPKVSGPRDLRAVRDRLGYDGPPLWAMIESARAMLALEEIVDVAAVVALEVLVVGTNDLAKDMRCRPGRGRTPLLPLLSRIVITARAHGLGVLDGVSNVIDDPGLVEAECLQGLDWGFDGKTLIHPSQIGPANRVFAPSETAVARARAIVAAFAAEENAGKGAIRLDGAMIERLHLEEARRTLAIDAAVRLR